MFPKVHDHCTSTSADAGLCAHALDLSPENTEGVPRIAQDGVCLIPQPSASPDDPLNWSLTKKNVLFGTVCLVSMAGVASVTVHQLAYVRQASYYHKSPVELSYSIAAGVAGQMGGPLLLIPLSSVIGRSSLIFWSLFGLLASNIWAPLMTGPNDYIPFVISRLLAGICGSVPPILAAGLIMDIYFLHQRGRAFTVLEVSLHAGSIAAPVFGGFIANAKPWRDVYWWLLGIIAVSIPLVFLFLEETSFQRDKASEPFPPRPKFFVTNRIATFFPGTAVVPRTTFAHVARRYITPFKISLSPVTIIVGFFVGCVYGFAVGLAIVVSIFLQSPVSDGGYGFTPNDNAEFNFSQWAGLLMCQICGMLLNDRVPLWISRRRGGAWHLEYRLYPILLIAAASPIGFGIFGAGIQYHLHFMILALGTFLVVFGACYSTPISINYIIECFNTIPLEVAVIMHVYRQILALALPFFLFSWKGVVSAGWLFGMMAFFCIFATLLLGVVMWKGPALRRWNFGNDATEEGVKIVSSSDVSLETKA
ncbi:putative polyamine transporter [Usnea florida]